MGVSYLEVRELSFAYGSKPVFSRVNLSVERGQVFCLVGPNGCGKTTLQHCILGHLRCSGGSVLVNGRPLASYSPGALAGEIAFVPQNHARSFPYRVVDVVAMGRMRTRPMFSMGDWGTEQAMEVLRRLEIDHLAETEYTTLSGGELQMVLMARALNQDSRILILDEPAAHLDVKRTRNILLLLSRIAKEEHKMILMSTHDFNHPLLFQDEGADVKMALMERGSLSRSGTPMEMLTSGCLEELYGIRSQVVEIGEEKKRHYLAAWSEETGW